MLYSGKKLLILGGTASMADTVRIAQRMGLYVVVVAQPISQEVMRYADKVYSISTADRAQVLRICVQEKIDGVYTSMSDLNPYTARWLCDELALPYYASMQQIEECNQKDLFLQMCREYGISVPKEWNLDQNDTICKESIHFPVIVKPARSCGTKGVTICDESGQLPDAILTAKSVSENHKCIIEEYIKGYEIVAYYTICNGVMTLSSVCDRYNSTHFDEKSLCQGYSYPSIYLSRFLEETNEKVISMFQRKGYIDGVVSLQMIATDTDFYVFEVGFRPGGTCQYLYTEALNGTNNVEMLLHYAMTGKCIADLSKDNADFSQHCCTLTINGLPGTIGSIYGLNEIRKIDGVLSAFQMKQPGEILPEGMSMSRIVFWVYIMQPTTQKLVETVHMVQDCVSVLDIDGNNMLAERFDAGRLPILF